MVLQRQLILQVCDDECVLHYNWDPIHPEKDHQHIINGLRDVCLFVYVCII